MRFLWSIGLLVGVILVICVPYFVGHGLAVHSSGWIVGGVICGLAAAGIIFMLARLGLRGGEHQPHA